MENHEDYLDALTAYGKSPQSDVPPVLEHYLNSVAKNGETLFQWSLLKPLVVGKMEQVIRELRQGLSSEVIQPRPNVVNIGFDVMHARIIEALHKFNGAPFTIQRLCELLTDPKRHYKRSDKFMRGLEKNVLVVSTVDPFGRKVVSESHKHLVNGMDNGSLFGTRDPHTSTPLPPVPGWVTSSVTMSVRSQLDSVGLHRQMSQGSTPDSGITSNGVTSGLVSSLYADQGDQPLSVHAEEIVEETVVTMDTNEVTNVVTDGGESLAEEDEEMAEETHASPSSSSSSSSEDLPGDTGIISTSPNVSSSSEFVPQGRPWATISNEMKDEHFQDNTSSEKTSITNSDLLDSSKQHEISNSSPNQSCSLSNIDVSPPSFIDQDSTSQTNTTLSWHSISTSEESSSSDPELVASTTTISTSTSNISSQPSSQTVIEEKYSFDLDETTSSHVTASSINQSIQNMEETVNSNTGICKQEIPCDAPTTCFETVSGSESPLSLDCVKKTEMGVSENEQYRSVCSNEAEAFSSDMSMAKDNSDNNTSTFECDSVSGVENPASSVEPSSSSSPGSLHSSISPISSSLSTSDAHHLAVSACNLPTQSSEPTKDVEEESRQLKLDEDIDSSSNIKSTSPSQQPVSEISGTTSDNVASSASEVTSQLDSTADSDSHPVSNIETSNCDISQEELHVTSEAGDAADEEVNGNSCSPPTKRTSSDSIGFEVSNEAISKSVGGEKERSSTLGEECVTQSTTDIAEEPVAMDQA